MALVCGIKKRRFFEIDLKAGKQKMSCKITLVIMCREMKKIGSSKNYPSKNAKSKGMVISRKEVDI